MGGAVIVGLVALAFAKAAELAGRAFDNVVVQSPYAPLLITTAGFALIAWITQRFAPLAAGSGIPQIIAANREPTNAHNRLAHIRTAALQCVLTGSAFLYGRSEVH